MANRNFRASVAMEGDPAIGVPGPLVMVDERTPGKGEIVRCQVMTRAEAEALRNALNGALRLIDAAAVAEADRPTAYPGPWPIRGATLADQGFA